MHNEKDKIYTFERIKNHPLFSQNNQAPETNKPVYYLHPSDKDTLFVALKMENGDVQYIFINAYRLRHYFNYNLTTIDFCVQKYLKKNPELTLKDYFNQEVYPKIKPILYLRKVLFHKLKNTITNSTLNGYFSIIKEIFTKKSGSLSLLIQQSPSAKSYLETLGGVFTNMLTVKSYTLLPLTEREVAATLLDNLPILPYQTQSFFSKSIKSIEDKLESIVHDTSKSNNNDIDTHPTNDNLNDFKMFFNKQNDHILLFREFIQSKDIATAKRNLLAGYHSLTDEKKNSFKNLLLYFFNSDDFSEYGFIGINISAEQLNALFEINDSITTPSNNTYTHYL